MTDQTEDRFKGTGQFHPDKAWAKIKTADFHRRLEAAETWQDRLYVRAMLWLLALIAVSLPFLLIWALIELFR